MNKFEKRFELLINESQTREEIKNLEKRYDDLMYKLRGDVIDLKDAQVEDMRKLVQLADRIKKLKSEP